MKYKRSYLTFGILIVSVVLITGCFGDSGGTGEAVGAIDDTSQQTCTPNWSCSDWSECSQGTHTRTCTDLNNCGSEEGKPIETEPCSVPTDKCSYINEIPDLTFTEKEDQLDTCYGSKYMDYVSQKNDVNICDEIVEPFYLGKCYSTIAQKNSDHSTCRNVKNIKYEAVGYYEQISSRDVCYYLYFLYKEDANACEFIENQQMKETCSGASTTEDTSKMNATIVVEDEGWQNSDFDWDYIWYPSIKVTNTGKIDLEDIEFDVSIYRDLTGKLIDKETDVYFLSGAKFIDSIAKGESKIGELSYISPELPVYQTTQRTVEWYILRIDLRISGEADIIATVNESFFTNIPKY